MRETAFFKDEVRNGFYIPTAIKQAWASALDVLEEVDRVCRENDIQYFAEWGTLLGTVRHGGFVPWDDDLDLCMKREDYRRFRELAPRELKKGFVLFDYANQKDHWNFITRVANSERICFEEEHLKEWHNFPYIASVDIFLLDYLYPDPVQEKQRCDEVLKLLALASAVTGGELKGSARESVLAETEAQYGKKLPRRDENAIGIALYALAEEQMARVPAEEAEELGQIFPFILKGGRGFSKHYYDKSVYLPFEDRQIPVPAAYAYLLGRRYGKYFKIHKQWGGHNYPFFEGQKKALLEKADFELPEYRFSEEMLHRHPREEEKSLEGISLACMESLREMAGSLETAAEESVREMLAQAQELAVELGTLTEQTYGEEHPLSLAVVEGLQEFCDRLYLLYEDLPAGEVCRKSMEAAVEKLAGVLQTLLHEHREVLFVCIGGREWEVYQPIYEELCREGGCEVSVVALPLFEKDPYGRPAAEPGTDPASELPEGLPLHDWQQYRVELRQPERIYIQFPYDGENPCLGIAQNYYAQNLQRCTEELVYVQPLRGGDFAAEDLVDAYNMKHYVTAPGVVLADRILVPSECMRQRYLEKLTEFAGEDSRSHWEERLFVAGAKEAEKSVRQGKKKLLFCVGANEEAEWGDALEEELRRRVQILEGAAEEVETQLCFYPGEGSLQTAVMKELREHFRKKDCYIPEYSLVRAEDYDAYYGSPSPLVLEFIEAGRPVMLGITALDK